MTAFADASSLVKLYADEEGQDLVRAESALVVSQLSRVEVPSALWRKHRIGDLSAAQARVLLADFEADFFGTDDDSPRFAIVAVTSDVLDEAARAVATHGLRAYDAVHLASAVLAHRAAPSCDTVLVWDGDLRSAAAREGFTVRP